MQLAAVTLDDKYTLPSGRIYLTGIQALVRLPMMQRQRDLAAGLNTGGFISGYRGSPLGMYDNALWRREALPEGEQHPLPARPQRGPRRDRRCGAASRSTSSPAPPSMACSRIWYGKGPGVDRSMDVLKHGNAAGTSPHGGVIALAGDDHGCQSSTLPHQSEQVFAAAMIPVAQSGDGPGISRLRPPGLRAVALLRLLDRLQGDRRDGRERRLGVGRSRAHPDRACRPTSSCRRAGSASASPIRRSTQERRLHGPKMAAVRGLRARQRLRPDGDRSAAGAASAS